MGSNELNTNGNDDDNDVFYDASDSDSSSDCDEGNVDEASVGSESSDESILPYEAIEEESQDVRTRSGRVTRFPTNIPMGDNFAYEGKYRSSGNTDVNLIDLSLFASEGGTEYTPCEERFFSCMAELGEAQFLNVDMISPESGATELHLVGAVGTQFNNTKDLEVKNYAGMMASPDKELFEEGIEVEHGKFVKFNCFDEVLKTDLKPEDEVIDGTWASRIKPTGEARCRMAARGFKQKDGLNYDSTDVSAPVICEISMRVCMILCIMGSWLAWIVDVEGAFLQGSFQNGEKIFMKVPEGFQKWYPSYVRLRLLRTIYGLIQAAMQFWREARQAMDAMDMEYNKADPCCFYKWTNGKLCVMLLWVDDFNIMGPREVVMRFKEQLKGLFEMKDVGEMTDYVGCKIERSWINRTMKMTQPVKIRRFEDEYDKGITKGSPNTPMEAGVVLKKEGEGINDHILSKEDQTMYRSLVAVMLHMMRWSRVEIMNSVRECSRFMTEARKSHVVAVQRIMTYCIKTEDRGLTLSPDGIWDGTRDFIFRIRGMSDSDYAKDESRHSVNGWSTWLCNAIVTCRSKMMPIIALSVMEAELYAAVQCVMDMMFIWRLLCCFGLKVELPMIIEVDNKGAVDFCNNWSVAGRTRHIEVKQYFLRELKEAGILKVKWKSGDDMTSDIFTKNLGGPLFEKHGCKFYGKDKYHIESLLKRNKSKGIDDPEISFVAFEAYKEYRSFWKEMIDDE